MFSAYSITNQESTETLTPEQALLNEIMGNTSRNQVQVSQFKKMVNEYAFHAKKVEGYPLKFDVIAFWNGLKCHEKYSQLARLSRTILAAPFSQVCVERCFSTFALCLTHLGTRLRNDLLNELLITRSNSDLVSQIQLF